MFAGSGERCWEARINMYKHPWTVYTSCIPSLYRLVECYIDSAWRFLVVSTGLFVKKSLQEVVGKKSNEGQRYVPSHARHL